MSHSDGLAVVPTRVMDAAVVIWVAAWIVVGFVLHDQVQGLSELSDTLETAAEAVDRTADVLRPLDAIPFIGQEIGALADRVSEAARSARDSARSSRARTENLAVLLGLSVAVAPTVPLLMLYVPGRVSRSREIRAIRRAIRDSGADPALQSFLADRAVHRIPFHILQRERPDPWRDVELGRYRALAEAELRRMGITVRVPPIRPGGTPEDGT
jgi:hypothetical protein